MLRNTFFAVLTVLAAAASSQAAIMLQAGPGVDVGNGLTSFAVSAVSNAGEIINGVNNPMSAAMNGGAGLHQVWTPITDAQTPTRGDHTPPLWSDTWLPFDSYFNFAPANSLSIGGAFTETNNKTGGAPLASAGFGAPGTGFGAFTGGGSKGFTIASGLQGTTVNLGQVVLKTGEQASLNLGILDNAGGNTPLSLMIGEDVIVDVLEIDPAFVSTDNRVPAQLITQQFTAELNGAPTTADMWSITGFTKGGDAGATPTNAPTISASGLFSWMPTLADLGAGGSDSDWQAMIRAADGNLTSDATFNIGLTIPEPTTMSLFGLAMVGAIGFIRRR